MRIIWKVVWKSFVVVIAMALGSLGANQAGSSGTELVVEARQMGLEEGIITGGLALVGALLACGSLVVLAKLAQHLLWAVVPLFLYSAIVLGAWNGLLSDFDWTRAEAIRHGAANAYALEHMGPRARLQSCKDDRIALTDDAMALCALTTAANSDRK